MKKIFSILCCVIMLLSIFAATVYAGALSPGIEVLQNDCAVLKTGVGINTVSFSEEDFLTVFGESDFLGIVITKLPSLSDGVLKLGSVDVGKGQIISKNAVNALRFIPNGPGKTASFGFLPYGKGYEHDFVCTVYMLDRLNFAPTANTQTLSAIEGIPIYGQLSAKDPEQDHLTYKLETPPENGTLLLHTDGSYCYTPHPNRIGKDHFAYTASDPYGNRSEPAEVTIDTEKNTSGIVYADMQNDKNLHSAVVLASNHALIGEKIGSQWYFYPEKTVTRGEFLMMAMKMNGIETELLSADDSGFADSAGFTKTENDYISAAADLGIVMGIDTENGRCFLPDEPITSLQASTIISRIAGLCGYRFADAVLACAEPGKELSDQGLAMMTSAGFVIPEDSSSPVTRADAAQLLFQLSMQKEQ